MDFAVAISNVFTEISSFEVIPEYLLPKEFQSQGWCAVEGTLGIVNKVLAVKYVELCAQHIECNTPETSLVSFLATTENVKVINSRKKLLLDGKFDPSLEWHVVTVLLRSHLYKHSKSPMLWQHRRWLLKTFNSRIHSSPIEEYEVVQEAAMHHPKNYYAWGYLRWYCSWSQLRDHPNQYLEICRLIKELSLKNLGDVSIWTFLHWLQNDELEEVARETDKQFPGHEAILASITPPAGSQQSLK